MIHDWWKNYLIISTDNPWMRVFKVKAALKKIRSQSETVAQIDRVWLKKNRSIPLSRNVFSKTRILRALLYQCKNDWHTNCFYKLNFHIIYYHSTWRREMFPFGRYCHINHSYFKTGTDNDVSILCSDEIAAYLYESILEFFLNCMERDARFDCASSEILFGKLNLFHVLEYIVFETVSPLIVVLKFVSLDSIRENLYII